MNHLSIDGVELNLPLGQEASFKDLIQLLKESLVAERPLISMVKIDGSEVNDLYEKEIASTPISQIGSVEVYTSHPRELADETLQHLIEYSHILENLSRSCASLVADISFHSNFLRLVEGITTFTEAITEVKKILKVRLLQSINLLEADLLSILKDLLSSQEANQAQYMEDLLKLHLPENLKQWREKGIQDLIRLRDC